MKRLALLLLLIPGCSSGPSYTPDEIQWRHQMALENWLLCETAYRQQGKTTFHRGHTHRRGITPKIWQVRQDLADNHCKRILGPYWAD